MLSKGRFKDVLFLPASWKLEQSACLWNCDKVQTVVVFGRQLSVNCNRSVARKPSVKWKIMTLQTESHL